MEKKELEIVLIDELLLVDNKIIIYFDNGVVNEFELTFENISQIAYFIDILKTRLLLAKNISQEYYTVKKIKTSLKVILPLSFTAYSIINPSFALLFISSLIGTGVAIKYKLKGHKKKDEPKKVRGISNDIKKLEEIKEKLQSIISDKEIYNILQENKKRNQESNNHDNEKKVVEERKKSYMKKQVQKDNKRNIFSRIGSGFIIASEYMTVVLFGGATVMVKALSSSFDIINKPMIKSDQQIKNENEDKRIKETQEAIIKNSNPVVYIPKPRKKEPDVVVYNSEKQEYEEIYYEECLPQNQYSENNEIVYIPGDHYYTSKENIRERK